MPFGDAHSTSRRQSLRGEIVEKDERVLIALEGVADPRTWITDGSSLFLQPLGGTEATSKSVVIAGHSDVGEPLDALGAVATLDADNLIPDVEEHAHGFRGRINKHKTTAALLFACLLFVMVKERNDSAGIN